MDCRCDRAAVHVVFVEPDGAGGDWLDTDVRTTCRQRAELERTNEVVEGRVKQRTAELKTEEERFRSLAECSPVGIFRTDETGRCVYVNSRWQEIYRMSGAQAAGEGWADGLHPADRARVVNDWAAAVRNGREYEGDFRVGRDDDSTRWVHARAAPIHGHDGALIGCVGSVEDVTDRRRFEAELQTAKSAAEAASKAKSEFLANMSHEIRTPMNGIIGMTELALDTDLTAEQREYLDTVRSSTDSLLTVINDILDFSKIEAGKLTLDPTTFSLRRALADVLKLFAARARRSCGRPSARFWAVPRTTCRRR